MIAEVPARLCHGRAIWRPVRMPPRLDSCLPDWNMKQSDLKERTMRFALDATSLCRQLQNDWTERRLSDQLFRSATSVAANYHAASRARSRREFLAKLGVVAEEAEETVFWLEFARRAHMATDRPALALCAEARELLAIFIASVKTVAVNVKAPGTRESSVTSPIHDYRSAIAD